MNKSQDIRNYMHDCKMIPSKITDLFTVVGLVPYPSSESEIACEADLVLVQTSYVFLWKAFLKNTS